MSLRPKPDESKLRKGAGHIFYEVQVLLELFPLRITPDFVNPTSRRILMIRNAIIESFAVHARNLIDFLYTRNPDVDDVIAEDYFKSPSTWYSIRPKKPKIFESSASRVGKEIVHLTYARIDVEGLKKNWPWEEMYVGIMSTIFVFLTHASPDIFGKDWDELRSAAAVVVPLQGNY
jgi:hypothetical protein